MHAQSRTLRVASSRLRCRIDDVAYYSNGHVAATSLDDSLSSSAYHTTETVAILTFLIFPVS